jgi:hypothetical protein
MDREFGDNSYHIENPSYFPKTTMGLYVEMYKKEFPREQAFDEHKFLNYCYSHKECPLD